MEDIFKNAYFGKPYLTRDGRKAIYLARDTNHPGTRFHNVLCIESQIWEYYYDSGSWYNELCNPINGSDIVSEYKISDEELDELAEEAFKREVHEAHQAEANGVCYGLDFESGYKAAFKDIMNLIKLKHL